MEVVFWEARNDAEAENERTSVDKNPSIRNEKVGYCKFVVAHFFRID